MQQPVPPVEELLPFDIDIENWNFQLNKFNERKYLQLEFLFDQTDWANQEIIVLIICLFNLRNK